MWTFNGQDVRRLRLALSAAREARLFKRIQAVMLVAQGKSPREAAQITGQKRWSVYKWLKRYRKKRCPLDLADRPRSGRPRAAAKLTAGCIGKQLARDPLALGYMATEWTVPLLAGHLQRTLGIEVSRRTLRRRFKSMGLAWKRPRYVYHLADPNRAQKKGR